MVMRRKLIKQGMGGFTVVLPITWIRKRNLENGGDVDIEERDSVLVISTEGKHLSKSTSLIIEKQTFKFYRSIIGGLYRGGYDEIHVSFTDSSLLPEIQKAIDLLPGFEILDITSKSCVIKSTSTPVDLDVHAHFLKMVHCVGAMQTIILEGKNWKELDGQLLMLRNNVLKNRDLIIRTIVQKNASAEQYLPYHTLVGYMWMIARTYYYLYQSIIQQKRFEGTTLLKKVSDYYHETFLALHHVDPYKNRTSFETVFSALTKNASSRSSPLVLCYLISITMLIEGCNSSLILLQRKKV